MFKKMKKSKYMLLSLGFIFIGLILVTVGLLFRNQEEKSSNKIDTPPKQNEIVKPVNPTSTEEIDYEELNLNESKITTIRSGEKKIDLEISTNKEFENYYDIYGNEKIIIQEIPSLYKIIRIYKYSDALCFVFSSEDTDSKLVYFTDLDGNIIKLIDFDRKTNISYSIKNPIILKDIEEAVTIENKTIKIVLSGVLNEDGYIVINGSIVNVKEINLQEYNITLETPLEMVISFEYLGNGEFSEEKIVEQKGVLIFRTQ